ncbi:HpcH/HpaI aldolase family protein [Rubellicoccus peritrichatus]|uniref:Aldolase/citrate lyase family protein n=1 Tax=Rubellicoccus peritrichatus TaxID=3080537 RepID=A0AAQ3LAH0_9BACT|nr:aldolase/citrate lyase family protein [Puniceicoccus sp. CR14]WOO40959.1 aldolase/citrate lyase family protein [Puniceicoccus sp. CR14]
MTSPRQKLKSGKPLIGSWINTGSPIVAELMAQFGFDFLCVDAEHSAVDLPQAQQIFQAIQSGNPNCAQFVRLHGVDYAFAKRYLDAGARGIIGPLVTTREEAELLVQATKYPPLGKRGVGFCRANQYGTNLQTEFDRANEEGVVAVQIEDIKAVENIDNILSVKGIDAAFIGPYDLSASMGLTAQFDHPDYIEARDRILEACKSNNVAAGIHVVKPDSDELLARISEGYRLVAFSLDITILTDSLQKNMSKIHNAIDSLA